MEEVQWGMEKLAMELNILSGPGGDATYGS